jgi:hypothetical protein
MSDDDTGGCRDHEKVEKAREKLRRRAPMTEPSQELRETPPSGAEPSEGEEAWLKAKTLSRPLRSAAPVGDGGCSSDEGVKSLV